MLRGMFQNHLLQLLSLVAVEPPAPFSPATLGRLLPNAIQGDASLFARSDEIQRAWQMGCIGHHAESHAD